MAKKSNSKGSKGSQLGAMRTLRAHVKTLYDYPDTTGDLSLAALDSIIDGIETMDNDVATKLERYSTAVDQRHKGFEDGEDPLDTLVLQIVKHVRADLGRPSKEAAVMQKLSVKIRGTGNRGKKNKDKSNAKTASADQSAANIPDEKSISRSETSFANRSKLFDDMVATLQSYGARYTTTTGQFSVAALKEIANALHEMTAKLDEAHMELKLSRSANSAGYLHMAKIFNRVKDRIEGHYNPKSPEFLAIKKLKMY